MSVKPKSRVSTKNSSQLTQFKFRWWMALILVAVIAVIGVVILRFSYASSVTKIYADYEFDYTNALAGRSKCGGKLYVQLQSSGDWCLIGAFQSGYTKFQRSNDGQCAFMKDGANQSKGRTYMYPSFPSQARQWVTVFETESCSV